MQFSYLTSMLLAALIPLFLGSLWYNPKTFGNAWMKACGLEEDKLKANFNAPLVFGLTYVLGFFIAVGLSSIVIHQFGFFGMLQRVVAENDANALAFLKQGFDSYGNEFRTFKHGALHGTLSGLFLALPIVTINALFERRGFKYIAINACYWILCFILMGGFICQFTKVDAQFFAQ